MAIICKQIAEDKLLIDFDRPVQPLGIANFMFVIPGFSVTSVSFQTTSAEVQLGGTIFSGQEVWVTYVGDPQIYFVTSGTPELVKPFEVLATVWGNAQTDPRVYAPESTSELPTIGDFIEAFGLKEAIEITNPDDRDAQTPDELKYLRALEDAEALWNSELYNATAGALLVLNPGKRRTLLNFVRYFLDIHCPRKHVVSAYEESIRNIRAVSGTTGQVVLDAFTGTEDFFYYGNKPCNHSCGCVTVGDTIYDVYRTL